MNSLLLS